MGVTQEGKKCIFMLCMEMAEEDMEVQEETVLLGLFATNSYKKGHKTNKRGPKDIQTLG